MKFTVKFNFGISLLAENMLRVLVASAESRREIAEVRAGSQRAIEAEKDIAWAKDREAERALRREILSAMLTYLKPRAEYVPPPPPVPPAAEFRWPSRDAASKVEPPPVRPDPDAAVGEELSVGQDAFISFVRVWIQNFGVEGAPQPDRAAAMMGVANGYGKAVTRYVRERGGLAGAVLDALVLANLCAPEDAALLARKVALNMVQVGSALALPMDRLIERSLLVFRANTLTDAELLATPLRGGPAGDTLDFDNHPMR